MTRRRPRSRPNQVGAASGTYSGALAGPPSAPLNILANTNTVGSFTAALVTVDRAGNRATKACPYSVGIPACNGRLPTIVGTGLTDTINGTSGNDVIQALGGNDTIYGGDHVDKLYGGDGDDFLDGGLGSDSLRGDGGRATCVSGEARMSSCEP